MAKLTKSDRANVTEIIQIDMTPMIDCVFQLILFFMLTMHFKMPHTKLDSYLPKDKGLTDVAVKLTPKELEEVRIRIDQDPASPDKALFYVGDHQVPDPRELAGIVQGLLAGKSDIPVTIDGQSTVHFRHVVVAADACRIAKVKEINYAPPIPDGIRGRLHGTVK